MRDMVSYAAAGEKRLEKSSSRYDLYMSEINDLMAQASISPANLFRVITSVYAMGVEAGARMTINKRRARR